jgi:hypothetical protein
MEFYRSIYQRKGEPQQEEVKPCSGGKKTVQAKTGLIAMAGCSTLAATVRPTLRRLNVE